MVKRKVRRNAFFHISEILQQFFSFQRRVIDSVLCYYSNFTIVSLLWPACNQKLYDRKILNNSRRTFISYMAHQQNCYSVVPCRHRETKENILHLQGYIKQFPRIYSNERKLQKIIRRAVTTSHVILSHVNPHLRLSHGETKSICRFAKEKKETNEESIEHDIARAIRSESPIMIAIWSRRGQQIVGVHGTVFKNQRTRYRDGSQHCVSISETRDKHPGWPLVLPSASCTGTARSSTFLRCIS